MLLPNIKQSLELDSISYRGDQLQHSKQSTLQRFEHRATVDEYLPNHLQYAWQ
jgi:hypothetical protein